MHWRRAARRGSKWACTGAAAACVVGFGVSVFWHVGWAGPWQLWEVAIQNGAIAGWRRHAPRSPAGLPPGLRIEKLPAEVRGFSWWTEFTIIPPDKSVAIPLWIPFLLAAVPAAWLWRGDRRAARLARAGSCGGCGYDRRGLAVGVKCPECGGLPTP